VGAAVAVGLEHLFSSGLYLGLGVSNAILPTMPASTTITVHVGLGAR